MKATDRYIIKIPAIKVTKVTVDADGAPVFQEFTEFGGVEYPGMTYDMVIAVQDLYVKSANGLVEMGKLSAAAMDSVDSNVTSVPRTGGGRK